MASTIYKTNPTPEEIERITAEHEAAKAKQEKASYGDDGAGLFNLADEPTPFHGFTENEWLGFSETYRRGVRDWAHEQASVSITAHEAQAWTDYISGVDSPAVLDAIFGRSYKYKAFFQNVRDAGNRDHFQVAENERNAITGAKGYIDPGSIANLSDLQTKLVRDSNSYSGCDITASLTIGGKTFVLGNLSTITYSIHRDKVPVRTLGRTYAKSYVSGAATIAGTLIFTVFDTHVLDAVRQEVVSEVQAARGQSSPLTQQLPPFDVTIFYRNEYGHASYMRIYGIEITDEAQGHSINDIYTENQMQYVARDIDLMCKVGSQFTPQALAAGNNTMFTQRNLSTPAFKLQHLQYNENRIGELQIDLARMNNEINVLGSRLAELAKSTPSAEVTNLTAAYTIQKANLTSEAAKKLSEITNLQKDNSKLTSSESDIDEAAVRYGSNFSSGRDDPYALSRGPLLQVKPGN